MVVLHGLLIHLIQCYVTIICGYVSWTFIKMTHTHRGIMWHTVSPIFRQQLQTDWICQKISYSQHSNSDPSSPQSTQSLPTPAFLIHAKLYNIIQTVNTYSKSGLCFKLDTQYNTYTNIIHQHFIQANWAQRALHNVGNGTGCHYCNKKKRSTMYKVFTSLCFCALGANKYHMTLCHIKALLRFHIQVFLGSNLSPMISYPS